MLEWLSDFIGGSKKSSGTATSESKTTTEKYNRWTPQQQQLFQRLAGIAESKPLNAQAPPMSVPQTGQESTYFNLVNDLARSRAATGDPLYDVGPEWADQYFQESIKPLYLKEFEEITMPGILKSYAGDFNTSGRREAQADAGENLALQLAAKRGELMYGEELAKRSAMDNALQQQQQVIQTAQIAGEAQRKIEEEAMFENVQRYLMGEEIDGKYNPVYNPQVQLMLSLLGLDPFVFAQESESTSNQKESSKSSGGVGDFISGVIGAW
jgi:hypothetical protein